MFAQWAEILTNDRVTAQPSGANHCTYVSRKESRSYALTDDEAAARYAELITLRTRPNSLFSSIMGNRGFLLKSQTWAKSRPQPRTSSGRLESCQRRVPPGGDLNCRPRPHFRSRALVSHNAPRAGETPEVVHRAVGPALLRSSIAGHAGAGPGPSCWSDGGSEGTVALSESAKVSPQILRSSGPQPRSRRPFRGLRWPMCCLRDSSGGSRQEDLLCRPRAMAQCNSAHAGHRGGRQHRERRKRSVSHGESIGAVGVASRATLRS